MSADRETAASLLVLADDWGRHPSSAQHLVRLLLPRWKVTWVNTVGMRRPRFTLADARRGLQRLRKPAEESLPAGLRVISPLMYPGFRRGWQRKLNAVLLTRAIERAQAGLHPSVRRIAVTTLPIAADLVGRVAMDRWVYYCVDDFSVWPGLDSQVMQRMERKLLAKVDTVAVVSEALADRLAATGQAAELLTHGIDVAHWRRAQQKPSEADLPAWWGELKWPIMLFWGLIDQRLDVAWCRALAERCGSLVLVGPQDKPPGELLALPNVRLPGAMPYESLPALAAAADVLVMPYADLPVTRAMQPLKFKEYLATGKPVVARKLPAIVSWHDAADLVESVEAFVQTCLARATEGMPVSQREARQRVAGETWAAKAAAFERLLLGGEARLQQIISPRSEVESKRG